MSDEIKIRQPRRQLLRTEAAEILRDSILMNRFTGGQKLNEKQLAEELGISRGPLREAFQCLEQEGMVYSVPNRGTFVIKVTGQDTVDLVVLRGLIEPYVVQQALKASSSLLKSIQQDLSQMYECAAKEDRLGVVKTHIQFHGQFYVATGNRFLKSFWDSIQAPLHHIFLLMTQYRPLIDIPNEHTRLIDLVAASDSSGLDQEIRNHFTVNWDAYMAYLKERGEDFLPLPKPPMTNNI